MKMIATITQYTKHVLNTTKKMSEISYQGLQLSKQRPFVALFLGAFPVTGFLPLLTYLLFICAVAWLGLILLVVIAGGIISMATVTLLVFLIIPACIASGFSVFAYVIYTALLKMKIFVSSLLNGPRKNLSGERSRMESDEKLGLKKMILSRRRAKIISDVAGNESDSKDCVISKKRKLICYLGVNIKMVRSHYKRTTWRKAIKHRTKDLY